MAKLAERGRVVGVEERWDPDGLQELKALYEPLRRFAAVVARWDVDPDDLVQDAYARVLRQCRADISELGPYLRKTIVHLASDSRRSARRAEAASRRLAEPDSSVDEYPSDLDELMRLPARTARCCTWWRSKDRRLPTRPSSSACRARTRASC